MQNQRLTPKGKITIPEEIRRGFSAKDTFTFERRDNEIVIKKVEGPAKRKKEQELTEWAKEQLSLARKQSEDTYISHEDLKREILNA